MYGKKITGKNATAYGTGTYRTSTLVGLLQSASMRHFIDQLSGRKSKKEQLDAFVDL